jgi:RHS repeat-associated protein
VVELSDGKGASAGSYRYDPYGDELDSGASDTNQSDSNPIRFSGQYLDSGSGLYDLRAREYDPSDGRFLETDPAAESGGSDFDLSDYLYAEDDPTLLTDPSGLDPRFGGYTLTCKKNKLLCSFIYGSGYKDGNTGYYFRKALTTLAWRGIEFEHLSTAAQGKGKVVNASVGADGPGLYFVSDGATAAH